MQRASGALDPQGPVAEAMAGLWWLMFWLGLAVFVAFAALLTLALFRRRSDDREADPRIRRWIVWGGVVMSTVVLVVVFGATVYAMRAVPNEAPEDALVIEIVGRQWTYDVHYPDEGVTTDVLHVPVGRPVALRLTSEDVIHSFWVPELGGKMDMLPDYTNTLVLQADEPAEYGARCAEFCGLHHANMVLRVVAEPPERFAAWIAQQQ